jgi:hypothetical protein
VLLLAGAEGKGCRGDREVAVRVVASDLQCGGVAEGVSVRRLATPLMLTAAMGGAAGGTADFEKEVVVLISAGRKPTAGFGLALASDKAPVKDGAAGVRIRFTSPDAGMMAAQVVTSPCLVVALPGDGLDTVGVLEGDKPVARVTLR